MWKLVCLQLIFFLDVIVVTICYDFHDSYYNQLLSTDLESIQDAVNFAHLEHPRVRRDDNQDKCHRRRFRGCCSTEFMDNLNNVDKELKKECYKEIYERDAENSAPQGQDPFKCEKVNRRKKDMTCFVQCVAKKKNLVDENGDIKEKEIRNYAQENFKDNWVTSHLDDIIPKCLNEARNATTNHPKSNATSCNSAAIKGAHCLFREIQMNCPEDQIKDKKGCAKFIEKMKRHQHEEEQTPVVEKIPKKE